MYVWKCVGPLEPTSEFVPHDVGRGIVINFGSQVLAGRQVLEPEQGVPVAGATATRIVLDDLKQKQKRCCYIWSKKFKLRPKV